MLLIAVKIRIQASKFGFEIRLIKTITNIADIRKYIKQSLMDPLFEITIKRITKSSTSYTSISL